MLNVVFDEKLGLVRVSDEGFYSYADEQRAADTTKAAIARCKALHGDLKVLVICDAMVQDAGVMLAAASRQSMLTGSYDRVAFVCKSSLQKLQASRVFANDKSRCFVSENAAITWLLADRGLARAV